MKKTLFVLIAIAAAYAALAQAQGLRRGNQGFLSRPGVGNRAGAAARQTPQPAAAANVKPEDLADGSSLNFNQTAIDLVFETYGRMVGKTILKDPQCPNVTITLKSEKGQKLTQDEQIEAIEIVLEMNGVHMEPYGDKFVRALPRKDVRKEGIPILDSESRLKESGHVVSMMIPFKNIGYDEAQKVLEGFKSASGILIAIERTNSILVTDTEQNINRMLEITRTIDVATPVLENVFVRQVKNANATEIKTALEAIVQESQKELEKSKGSNSNVAQPSTPRPGLLGGLRRPGQNNQQQAPVNNASLVMTVSDADRGMIRGKVLILADERSNKLIIVTQKANMDFFDKVIEQLDVETTPDTVVKVYRLKYADAEDVSDMINDLIGNSVSSKNGSKNSQNQNAKKGTGGNITRNNSPQTAKKSANQRTGDAKAGELSKENTTVLADKRINGLVVMTMKELVPTIEQIIESMDIKLSQVLIETCIIEVSLGDDLKTGVDWISRGKESARVQDTDGTTLSNNGRYYVNKTTTTYDEDGNSSSLTEMLTSALSANERLPATTYDTQGREITSYSLSSVPSLITTAVRDNFLNSYSGGAYAMGGGGQGGTAAAAGMITNVISAFTSDGGFNCIWKSDSLNLGAIIQATKSDSRAKYLASPIIMTVDNKEAEIEATEMRYFFKGYASTTYTGGVTRDPDYEQKEVGITIKVTPKINPNGTVMLEIENEYSQINEGGQTVPSLGTVDTTITRKMSADALLDNMQTVILGGLTETTTSESESGIPILKDIPYIGKWLFGTVKQSEGRKELLIFMTPYVLADSDEAQFEALRRKKALSDSRPWEDHGWSASNLADPISKKEQMRRIKDEWKKQDEERKTRIEIEKEKINRAKHLKELTEEERDLWLKLHKEELEKEQQEELEKKMLDKESQEELKKLAAEIRAKKLGAAEAEIKKAEEETAADNERAKIDAAKKEKEKEKSESSDKSDKRGERGERPVSRDPVASDVAEPQVSLDSLAPRVKPEGGEKGDVKAEKETR